MDPNWTSHTSVRAIAECYVAAGVSVIPVTPDGSKSPFAQLLPCDVRGFASWKPFQTRLPNRDELYRWFTPVGDKSPPGIGIVAGQVSGGLEILDLDNQAVVEPWIAAVQELAPGLLEKLVFVQTPRPGLHVYYRCNTFGGNEKLALEPGDAQGNWKTLIEVKGEGGYVLAPGSPGQCHPTGRCYMYHGNRGLWNVSMITRAEREVLMLSARALNRQLSLTTVVPRRLESQSSGNRVGDDFNRRATWEQVLGPHNWTFVGAGSDGGEQRWRRPGKSEGCSATTGFRGFDRLYVFSQNASPLEAGRTYDKFAAFTLLGYGGDFRKAVRALLDAGWGRQSDARNARLAVGRRR